MQSNHDKLKKLDKIIFRVSMLFLAISALLILSGIAHYYHYNPWSF